MFLCCWNNILHFENLIQKIYQFTACEQALLCEFRENFAHLLCFYWLVSWQPESWEIQKSTARVQAHFSPLNSHKRVCLPTGLYMGCKPVANLFKYSDAVLFNNYFTYINESNFIPRFSLLPSSGRREPWDKVATKEATSLFIFKNVDFILAISFPY